MSEQRVLLILNPVAGRKAAKKALYPIVQSLCENERMATVFSTSKKGEATDIVRAHASEYDRVICCGGDGTLNEVLRGVMESGCPLSVGYIPCGTTNDLAHALKLPTALDPAIRLAVGGGARKHDVGVLNEQFMFDYVASFGAFVDTAYNTPQRLKNALGRGAYFLFGMRSMLSIRPYHLRVEADGRVLEGDFLYGSVSNTTKIAGIIELDPSAIAFDDGKFEVLLIRHMPTLGALRAFKSHKYDPKYFYFFSAHEVRFTFTDDAEWTVDGECAGTMKEVVIRNIPGAVQLVAPEKPS